MDNDVSIIRAIMELHPALAIDDQIHLATKVMKGLAKAKADIAMGNTVVRDDAVSPTDNKQQKHQYTQADFKFNPMQALQGDKATCVLCGKKFDVISKTHLWVSHGITPEEYRNLCGYPPEQNLMTEGYRQQRGDKLRESKVWEKTKRWQDKQKRDAAARDAAAKAVDEIDTDDKSTPKETPKDAKSDTKPQYNASGKPEKKDDKGDNAPKS
jgi:predicted transcriptional regulator